MGLHQLFKDDLREHYEVFLETSNNREALSIPNDFYTAISEATDQAGDDTTVELKQNDLVYLFELCIITKTGNISSHYVRIEWHVILIPQIINSLLRTMGLYFPFINDTGA
jgi:hypothetical protein